jgi:hypothetical protein
VDVLDVDTLSVSIGPQDELLQVKKRALVGYMLPHLWKQHKKRGEER